MATELERTQNRLNGAMESSLANASAIITKSYLSRLEDCRLVPPSLEDKDTDIAKCGSFYRLTRLVFSRGESFLNRLTTIVNVASSIDCSLVTIVDSDGYRIDYYFGILSKNARTERPADQKRRSANAAAFKGALSGNLIGSQLEELPGEEVGRFRERVLRREGNCYCAVSGIVSRRDRERESMEGYVQGIENLVDSLKGKRYTIVMIADPVDTDEIQVVKQGYEILHTQLSSFARRSVTLNESDTLSLSRTTTDSFTEGISTGIAMTQSKTRSKSKMFGVSAGIGFSFGISANIGINAGRSSGTADTEGTTRSRMESRQRGQSVADGSSAAKTAGKSLQLSYENRSVKALLDKIDRHLQRLDECESYGAFDCAAYVIAQDRETALAVAGNYNALMRGKDSGIQASHINAWYRPEQTRVIGDYLASLTHPRFYQGSDETIVVTPASIVSGDELAIQIGLPKKSVAGVTVIPMAPFGRNLLSGGGRSIALGNLYHMGRADSGGAGRGQVALDVESLCMHTFITGSTGAGKTTTLLSLLHKLMAQKVEGSEEPVTFLVIEPAKGEYKEMLGGCPGVRVYGTNEKKMPLLTLNPFSFPEDIHVLEHIDRLIEIFNVCWPMYAAMPAVLKDAVERAYEAAGWNLETSESRYRDGKGRPLFPTFMDVLSQVRVVMEESAYSADSKGDYQGALCTRLRSLTMGLYRRIFTGAGLPEEELFDKNAIVDLSRVGSGETKSLIMGLLVMKLQEHRMAHAGRSNAPLRHVTVLEEAHHILKRTSTEQTGEGANVLGKSVEMLSNSIAEMRAYGEGFIIADQAPGLMDLSVIRNTNTKIILRLPDLADRELVGRAAGLNEEQILELSRLKTFVAAVYQNDWLEPVLCEIEPDFRAARPLQYAPPAPEADTGRQRALAFLLLPPEKMEQLDDRYLSELADSIHSLPISTEAKLAFFRCGQARGKEELQSLRGQAAYALFNAKAAFGQAGQMAEDPEGWYERVKAALEPDITHLSQEEQKKIVAVLAKREAELENTRESQLLFERLMTYL